MGKLLNNSDLVMRTGKLAFYKCLGESFYRRMEGFTELSNSKGTKEYTRQYIDEDFERTDVSGYSPEKSYAFDRYKHNAVLDDIIYITENELIGQAMVRQILVLDMTTETFDGVYRKAKGKVRHWAVVPDTDGDTTDCMTYSGTFKCRGEMTDVIATSTDNWQTVSNIVVDEDETALIDISIKDDTAIEVFAKSTTTANENMVCNIAGSSVSITASATKKGATIVISRNGGSSYSGINTVSYTESLQGMTIGSNMEFVVICTYKSQVTTAKITLVKVDSYDETGTQSLSLESEE